MRLFADACSLCSGFLARAWKEGCGKITTILVEDGIPVDEADVLSAHFDRAIIAVRQERNIRFHGNGPETRLMILPDGMAIAAKDNRYVRSLSKLSRDELDSLVGLLLAEDGVGKWDG